MKLKFYILFALCFMLVNGASAQGYTVSRDGNTDKIIVTVSGDCSIPVSEFATALGENVHVYGNANRGGEGGCFASNTALINEAADLNGFTFNKTRASNSAIVDIDFEKIKDGVTLEFYKAIWRKKKGYCPDQTFSVIFRKRTESAPSNNTGEKPLTIEELTCELNEMKKNWILWIKM